MSKQFLNTQYLKKNSKLRHLPKKLLLHKNKTQSDHFISVGKNIQTRDVLCACISQ